ncbi:hypothetical protein RSSM_06726 [Rhodopirellula sallentina SM41]|uniref:Uncharacterized protein n=1 Tax=Rhodopirellula sallentina SM41 TaxID=1263870 RepID=M5TS19_9BACT|nr:hypothetical protein RSSM_06726 [Rhodopirellula sallentina SM41]
MWSKILESKELGWHKLAKRINAITSDRQPHAFGRRFTMHVVSTHIVDLNR